MTRFLEISAISTAAALILSGCLSTESIVQETARDVAKRSVNGVISQKFPGANVSAYTDCVIDNASTAEIAGIAKNSIAGAEDAVVSQVSEIASRQPTTICITQSALASLIL